MLLKLSSSLRDGARRDDEMSATRSAVASVLEDPIRQLIDNAKESPTKVLAEISKSQLANCGFNSEGGKVEDLVASGVLDATKTLEWALRLSLSHAAAVLQTGAWDVSPPPSPPNSARPRSAEP